MGSDKSFDTLLNKYNILLAQTKRFERTAEKFSREEPTIII